jgi:peroxiredoxin
VQAAKAEFDRREVAIAVISFAQPATLVHYQQHHHWPFTLLADPDRKAYRIFALKRLSWFRVFAPATLRLYARLLREGMKPQGYGKDDIYQAGGDFLLDRSGNILFAHRSLEPADRPPIKKLLQAIDSNLPTP